MSKLIVIYDDDCTYCSTATNVANGISGSIQRVPLSDQQSQAFIDEQFGYEVFTLITIDLNDNTVYLGEDALNKINNNITNSDSFSRLISKPYEQISEFTSIIEGRDNDITDYEGVEEITSEAKLIAEEMVDN